MSQSRSIVFILATLALITSASAQPSPEQAPGPLRDARLLQITLPVRNLDRALEFYQDKLGLRVLFRVPDAVFLDAAGVRLRLAREDAPVARGITLYFADPGLLRAAPLAARGIHFLGPPQTVQHLPTTDLQLLEFSDPDGNALALMGEVPRPK